MSKKSLRTTGSKTKFTRDKVCIVESNVDDVTGEVLARALEVCLSEGAFDATATPFTGKKGRPGFTVRVTCSKEMAAKFASVLVRETGTLGVKLTETDRWIVKRSDRLVEIQIGSKSRQIRLKVASIDGRSRFKPEFEDVKKLANEFRLPVRSVLEIVSMQVSEKLD